MTRTTPVILALVISALSSLVGRAQGRVILDALGSVGTDTVFDLSDSNGTVVGPRQLVGPEFTLRQRTRIIEIGAYLNNCDSIVSGVVLCTAQFPLVVEIHASTEDGHPARDALVTLQLTHDHDPLHIRYEFVQPNIVLPAGRYFALFAPRWETDSGMLLTGASSPLPFVAGHVALGTLDPQTGLTITNPEQPTAVRILGIPPARSAADR